MLCRTCAIRTSVVSTEVLRMYGTLSPLTDLSPLGYNHLDRLSSLPNLISSSLCAESDYHYS